MGNRKKILIIDDDKLVCNSIANVAKTHRTRCLHRPYPERRPPGRSSDLYDLVFLDVHMPDGNGIEKLPQISKNFGNPEVIIITAYADPDSVNQPCPGVPGITLKNLFQKRPYPIIERCPPLSRGQ